MTSIVYGSVAPASTDPSLGERIDRLLEWIGGRLGVKVERRDTKGYEALAKEVREGKVDVAWLPPIVFVRLAEVVVPIGSVLRDGRSTYEAALVVRADSRIKNIEGLKNSRAGWVDPWSAAGFVLPRVKLALSGIDPRSIFRTETFYGSHRAALRSLIDGSCDVAGTYARADTEGVIESGAWSEITGAEVRVLATFGAIPPDVIGSRADVDPKIREGVLEALREACRDDMLRPLIRGVFGGDQLQEGLAPGYDSLKKALEMATGRGLFD